MSEGYSIFPGKFTQSFALIDAKEQLVDWDYGFAQEWVMAGAVLKPGVPYSDLLRAVWLDPIGHAYLKKISGLDDLNILLRMRREGYGGKHAREYTAEGRTILIEEEVTASGGVHRMARDTTKERQAAEIAEAGGHLETHDLDPVSVVVVVRRTPDGVYLFPALTEERRRFYALPRALLGAASIEVKTLISLSPEDEKRCIAVAETAAQTLETSSVEYSIRDGKNRFRWIRQSFVPQREPDGGTVFSSIMRDITSEKAAEEQIDLLRSVVTRSTDCIVIVETDKAAAQTTTILYVNPKLENLFGQTSQELVGKPVESLRLFSGDLTRMNDLFKTLRHNSSSFVQFEMPSFTGEPIWVEARADVIQKLDNGCLRWVAIARDITERRQAQEEMQSAKEAAEAGNRAKSQFLAKMSHELRTPLNAIIGFSEIIESGIPRSGWKETYLEYTHDIGASGRHLLNLVNSILDLSKIEAGSLELDISPVDLEILLQSCVSVIAVMAQESGIALSIPHPPDHVEISGDFQKLKQVLINVLSNAVKFTPAGGRVTVETSLTADTAVITVTDSGCGIPAKELARVTLPFTQGDNSLARQHEGTGLGLTIAKQLCELHGGSLAIESTVGHGTVVRITLPR